MDGQRIGYVRVSTLNQNEGRQFEGRVLDRVFTDKASGRDTGRPQLAELLRFVHDGDTAVVQSMDRMARNLDDLRALVQGLTRRGVRVEFLKEQLVFTGEDSPGPTSCSPSWVPSPNSKVPNQGTATRRHRPG
jgi:DNA invertase Pin-like site-specific DNA recombinase